MLVIVLGLFQKNKDDRNSSVLTGLFFLEQNRMGCCIFIMGIESANFVIWMSEFAFFQSKNKIISRSILILFLYNASVITNMVKEGAAADGCDSM